MLSEFLEAEGPGLTHPPLRRRALVHGHCHHKAVMQMGTRTAVQEARHARRDARHRLLRHGRLVRLRGGHYDDLAADRRAQAAPAHPRGAKDTLIIADGFSCKQQIQEMTDRRALHLAQVLQMALHAGPGGPPGGYPESASSRRAARRTGAARALVRTGVVLGVGALLVGGTAYALKRRGSA